VPVATAPTIDRQRRETVVILSDVLRDIGGLKRDLLREVTCDVPFAALSALGVLQQHGSMRVGELAECLAIDLSVASRHASGLEDRGLVARRPSEADKRAHQLSLTAAGEHVLVTVRKDLLGRLDAALDAWSESDLRDFASSLTRLRSDLSTRRAQPGPGHASA
jgi:DNA-binding MarR family transcriptional regulator